MHHQLSNPCLPLSKGADIRKVKQLKDDHHVIIIFQCLILSQMILMEDSFWEIVLPEHLLEVVRVSMSCLAVFILKYSDLSCPVVLVNLLMDN